MRRFKQLLVFLFWPVFSFGRHPGLSTLGVIALVATYQGWVMFTSPRGELESGQGILFAFLAIGFYLVLGGFARWRNHSIETP